MKRFAAETALVPAMLMDLFEPGGIDEVITGLATSSKDAIRSRPSLLGWGHRY